MRIKVALSALAVGGSLVCMTSAVSACSSPDALQSSYFEVVGVSMGGDGVRVGQVIDFDGRILAGSPGTITLLSAQLIPLPGFRLPKLTHLAVVSGCGLALPSSTWDWPPRIAYAAGGTAPVKPFTGTAVWTGARGKDCLSAVVYGVTADAFGPYACGGLRITFRTQSAVVTAPLFSGCYAWFDTPHLTARQIAEMKTYEAENAAAFQALNSVATS